jgi:hypothetical protein
MKTAVPGEIVNSGGRFKENDRRTGRKRRLTVNSSGEARDLEIIEMTSNSSFDALSEEFVEHCPQSYQQNLAPTAAENHFFS